MPAEYTLAIPTLETERLTMRGHRPDDLQDSAAMWGDPDVTRYIGGKPATREEVWSKLLRIIGHWATMGFGYWVVREKGSERFVGEVGLAVMKREMDPPLGNVPECGWSLAPWAHGRGYATEAVRAALKWIETQRGARHTLCIIDPANTPSLRVAEKCGYRETRRTTYKGDATIVLERFSSL